MDEKSKDLAEEIKELKDARAEMRIEIFDREQDIKDLEAGILKLIKVIGHEARG